MLRCTPSTPPGSPGEEVCLYRVVWKSYPEAGSGSRPSFGWPSIHQGGSPPPRDPNAPRSSSQDTTWAQATAWKHYATYCTQLGPLARKRQMGALCLPTAPIIKHHLKRVMTLIFLSKARPDQPSKPRRLQHTTEQLSCIFLLLLSPRRPSYMRRVIVPASCSDSSPSYKMPSTGYLLRLQVGIGSRDYIAP